MVIILLGGQGTRLNADKNKCLMALNGQTLLGRQLQTLLTAGVKPHKIRFVLGYKKNTS